MILNMNNLAYKLIQNYKIIPNKICLIQHEQMVTYSDLYRMVSNFKYFLERKGICKEQKILVLVPMSIELYVTLLAIWAIGAIPCFMDESFIKSRMKTSEFEDINAIVGNSKYIVYSNINSNLRKLNIKINVNKITKSSCDKELEICEVDKDFPGILTYTSGTTGKPKIASRTHEFLLDQGEILKENMDYDEGDIELSTMPIFTLANINAGITTVIADAEFSNLEKSSGEKLIIQIKKNNINRIMASPGLLEIVINYCESRKISVGSIKKVFTGGGAVFIDFIDRAKIVFPNANIVTIYGSTEAEPIAKLNIKDMSEEDIEKIKNGYGILAGNIIRC